MLLGMLLTYEASSLSIHSKPELLQKIVRSHHRSLSCPNPPQNAMLDRSTLHDICQMQTKQMNLEWWITFSAPHHHATALEALLERLGGI